MEENKSQQQRENEYLEEITKVHKMYQQEIENNRNFVETTRVENLKLAEIAKTYKENQKFLKKAYKHYEKDYKLLKMQLDQSLNEQRAILMENGKLKQLLEMQNDEKNVKSMAVDQLFSNAAKENNETTSQKNIEEPQIVIAVPQTRKKGKTTFNNANGGNSAKKPRKSFSMILKEDDRKEKNVDTHDLVMTYESETNTDLIIGAKNINFQEKSTQTIDKSQFIREITLTNKEFDDILKEEIRVEKAESFKKEEEIRKTETKIKSLAQFEIIEEDPKIEIPREEQNKVEIPEEIQLETVNNEEKIGILKQKY